MSVHDEDPGRRARLRGDLRAIYTDGLAFSLMVGMGETYLPAFALALGFSSLLAGLVATVPMMIGASLQLVSPWGVRRMRSHRRWVVACASLQAASFLPLVIAALAGRLSAALLFAVAALYWGAGLATGPAWNVWVETLVPRRVRIRYFARRSRMLHVFVVLGLFAAGWILQAGAALAQPLQAFALIFLFALLARTFSAFLLASQSEPQPLSGVMRSVGLREFLRRFRGGRDGRLLVYMLSVQFTVQIAAPYFTPYMLGPLRLSYATYMSLIAAAVLAKFSALPLHGWIAQRFGIRTLLWIGGLGIVPASFLWIVTDAYGYLLVAQLFAGAAWAAWELATLLLFFDTIRSEERTSVLTTFNLAHSTATAAGALVGGALLESFGGGARAFVGVFAVSFGLRFGTLLFLKRIGPAHVSGRALATGTEALRPTAGTLEEPILTDLPRQDG